MPREKQNERVPAPQKQSRVLRPQSQRITSGKDGATKCIPNELTSFTIFPTKEKSRF